MKNILTESFKSNFKTLANKPANVLKRIQGVLSDFKSNRNGRIYPRELWENVLSSDYVKEMIESHGLVGELDHPEERLEISLQNVSHVINDMWIEDDKVMGIIDILPTPSGKIVNELLDYGTDIGISSRGAGSVGDGNIVDPDYQFITFDFVARPSCEAARLNTILEGVQYEIDTNSDDKVNAILESYKESVKEDKKEDEFEYQVVMTIEKAPLKYETKVYDTYSSAEQASDKAGELRAQGIAATVVPVKDNKEAITEDVDVYKNIFQEYCDGKIKKLGTVKVDNVNVKVALVQEIRDYGKCKVLDGTDTIEKLDSDGETLEFVTEDGKYINTPMTDIFGLMARLEFEAISKEMYDSVLEYWDDTNMSEIMERWHSDLEEGYGDRYRTLDEMIKLFKDYAYNYEVKAHREKNEFYKGMAEAYEHAAFELEHNLNPDTHNLNESVLSDQEVYKTVLGWYKQQIEAGNMTLNQAYELLSDKAKVSLNKMVDQNKIKESILSDTINELLNESIELNK